MNDDLGLGKETPNGFQPRNTDGAMLKSLLRDVNNPELTGAQVPKGVDPIKEVDAARRVASQAQADAMLAAEGMGELMTAPAPAQKLRSIPQIDQPIVVEGPAESIDFAAAPASKAAKLCFTGRTHVGKDYVANAIGAKIFGFADPLYDVLEYFFGTRQRDIPGARAFMQKVGPWGRGEISASYPLSPERASFMMWMRAAAAEGKLPAYVNWNDFGFNQDIWLDACLRRLNAFVVENPNQRVAISNVRFDNELKRLTAEGFIHTHVVCSATTWAQRLAKDKIAPDAPILKDLSEQLAARLDASVVKNLSTKPNGGKIFCIWNDTVKIPSARLLTLPELHQQIATREATL